MGELVVSGGGTVTTNLVSTIGNESSGIGIATVVGAGSQWNTTNSFAVGERGTGTLNILSGGVVNNPGAAGSVGSGGGLNISQRDGPS